MLGWVLPAKAAAQIKARRFIVGRVAPCKPTIHAPSATARPRIRDGLHLERERAIDDGADVAERVFEGKRRGDFHGADRAADVGVFAEQRVEFAFAAKRFHRIALNPHIRFLPRHPAFDQRQEHRFARPQTACVIQIRVQQRPG